MLGGTRRTCRSFYHFETTEEQRPLDKGLNRVNVEIPPVDYQAAGSGGIGDEPAGSVLFSEHALIFARIVAHVGLWFFKLHTTGATGSIFTVRLAPRPSLPVLDRLNCR